MPGRVAGGWLGLVEGRFLAGRSLLGPTSKQLGRACHGEKDGSMFEFHSRNSFASISTSLFDFGNGNLSD